MGWGLGRLIVLGGYGEEGMQADTAKTLQIMSGELILSIILSSPLSIIVIAVTVISVCHSIAKILYP